MQTTTSPESHLTQSAPGAEYARVWVDALNRRDLDVANRIFAPDCVVHLAGIAEPIRGVEAWKQVLAGYFTAFPDLRFTLDDHVQAGERVAHRWHCSGTHTGPLGAVPPTGRSSTVTGLSFDRVVNDTVVERWEQFDYARMLQQLGLA